MAGFYIRPEEKPSNKLKARETSNSNLLNSWVEFWKMFKNFTPKKIKGLAEKYAGADRLKQYNEILGK